MVAIPLGMALAIAAGVAPQYGLYTVIIGGAIIAILGGSRFQVSGPTAAFVVILAPITEHHGLGGLLVSGFMAGFILVAMGYAKLGKFIQYIPYPVKTGFTAGIGVVIAALQLKDFFGIEFSRKVNGFIPTVKELYLNAGTWSASEFAVGAATLLLLFVWLKINRKIPAPLVALSVIGVATYLLKQFMPGFQIETIGTRFDGGIPAGLPPFSWPWDFPDETGSPLHVNFTTLQFLFAPAFAIALLGAIESLLSAVVADGMARSHHDPDNELIAQGIGNIVAPFFGGIAATGAIARTATNIRFGARSPISAVVHSVFALIVMLSFSPLISHLPMAALAALLIYVAWMMSEPRKFIKILKISPKSDVAVLLLCFSFTVIFDMVIGVSVGMVLASFLFMRRMAELTRAEVYASEKSPELGLMIPDHILLYRINGPLFFGAADSAIQAATLIDDRIKVIVFDVQSVPFIDATGLVSLENAFETLEAKSKKVAFCGLAANPRETLAKAQFFKRFQFVQVYGTVKEAVGAFPSKHG